MRTETLTESQDAVIALEPAEAEALRALGERLASKKAWWGDDPSGETKATTVIRVRSVGDAHWSVRVSDAVGLVSIGALQLLIVPKIPTPHLLYLFARSGAFPRLDEQAGEISAADSLWELVATWFVRSFERLLRRDLVRDYEETTDDLRAARGRIELARTTTLFYAARPELACRFDEFGFDTPLNRVLRAATRSVVSNSLLGTELRRRARRLEDHLADVGELRPDDLLAATDRRTGHYADAISLARSLLWSTGRSLSAGGSSAWTFLIRTPEMVEAGVRAVLAERLGPETVRKEGRQLVGSSLTFNPDLVFGAPSAVGDVKYKLAGGDWDRGDLYQVVAFAAAFRVDEALLVRFRGSEVAALPDVKVGDIGIREVTWLADPEVTAGSAATALAEDVEIWLADVNERRMSRLSQVA
jgi:hypothetical protein